MFIVLILWLQNTKSWKRNKFIPLPSGNRAGKSNPYSSSSCLDSLWGMFTASGNWC